MNTSATLTEVEARLLWVRFDYTRTESGAEPDMSTEDLDYLSGLDEEHEYVTGQRVTPLDADELTAWYGGVGAAVRAVLGDYVRF